MVNKAECKGRSKRTKLGLWISQKIETLGDATQNLSFLHQCPEDIELKRDYSSGEIWCDNIYVKFDVIILVTSAQQWNGTSYLKGSVSIECCPEYEVYLHRNSRIRAQKSCLKYQADIIVRVLYIASGGRRYSIIFLYHIASLSKGQRKSKYYVTIKVDFFVDSQ